MTVCFVIDDLPWADTGLPRQELTAGFETLAELLRGMTRRRERILAPDDLYEIKRIGERNLRNLLDWQNHDLPRDLRVELLKMFDRVATIDNSQLVELEVSVAGAVHVAAAVAYATTENLAGRPVGVLTPACSSRGGRTTIRCARGEPIVHFISDEESRLEFVREVIVKLTNEEEFIALTASAFPRLYFVDGVFDGLRALSKPLRDLIADLVHHLSVLSDHGKEIFAREQHKLIEVGFQEHGIDISPESHETMADGKCRAARIRVVSGVALRFEWHTKIQRHIDRIHVHPGAEVTDGQVAVGVIRDHLPLPGD